MATRKATTKAKRGRGRGKGGNSTRSLVDPKRPPRAVCRPTVRSENLVEEVLERVIEGEMLGVILRPTDMPHRATWWRWCEADPALSRRYDNATRLSSHPLGERGLVVAEEAPDIGMDPRHANNIGQRSQWLAARRNPAVYGDRLEHAVDPTSGKTIADILVAARQLRQGKGG